MASNRTYLLDSFSTLAYLGDEPGRARVQEVLTLAAANKCHLVMSLMHFSEALYIIEHARGLPAAQTPRALIERILLDFVEASRNSILDAALIKVTTLFPMQVHLLPLLGASAR